jgi:CheY-like chemotaxis protein/HPt (histidine-containing phosphotransfer) domain-containing protein
VALPVTQALPEPALDTPAPAPAEAKRMAVLVADDNPVNLKVASAMLGRLGYAVLTAANGREVVDAVSQALAHGSSPYPIGVVLMDVNMPELDGLQATQLILAQHGTAAPPVIAMTASILEEERQGCIDVGMVGSVLKPLLLDDLAQALLRWARVPEPIATKSIAGHDQPAWTPGDLVAEAGPGGAQLVDFARLNEFKEYDDASLSMTRGVVGMYLHDVPHRLAAMEAAIAAGDAAALYKAVHALKGSAGNVGALALETLCLDLEMGSARGQVPPGSAGQLGRLRQCADQTAQVLAGWV